MKVKTNEIVARLKLEVDGHLETLHKAMEEGNQEQIAASKQELSAIHDSLVALGHYPGEIRKVELPKEQPVEA